MPPEETRGFTLLDLLFVIAFLGLLVWLVRLDWSRPPPAVHGATHSSCTSV